MLKLGSRPQPFAMGETSTQWISNRSRLVGIQNSLGDELRKAREAVGLTQTELAERADVRSSYVGQVERGRSPSIDALFSLCDVLGLKASKIIARIERKRD